MNKSWLAVIFGGMFTAIAISIRKAIGTVLIIFAVCIAASFTLPHLFDYLKYRDTVEEKRLDKEAAALAEKTKQMQIANENRQQQIQLQQIELEKKKAEADKVAAEVKKKELADEKQRREDQARISKLLEDEQKNKVNPLDQLLKDKSNWQTFNLNPTLGSVQIDTASIIRDGSFGNLRYVTYRIINEGITYTLTENISCDSKKVYSTSGTITQNGKTKQIPTSNQSYYWENSFIAMYEFVCAYKI